MSALMTSLKNRVAGNYSAVRQAWRVRLLKRKIIPRSAFLADVRIAAEQGTGYAAGKIGRSQQYWMYYEILLAKNKKQFWIDRFEKDLKFNGLKQVGIFPADPAFYRRFNDFYMPHVRNLDCLGICLLEREWEICRHYGLRNKSIFFVEQEPDRSFPHNEDNCYLPSFRGKRLLIVCPFAEVLKGQATKEKFEGVWANTGKQWFYPASVDALEFPYGFTPDTQKRFGTAINLFEHIVEQINQRSFDVALIGAAGLGIPLASYVKSQGKIGIELGGHLQVLFGVHGKRWRDQANFQRYFTKFWIDVPEKYRPAETDVCDKGAYW